MTIAYWCVLVGGILPLVWVVLAKAAGPKPMTLAHNASPREFLATVEGMQKRANFAQQNAFEAFPLFAAAVLIAHMNGLSQAYLDQLALLWVAARLAHGVFYCADLATPRSAVYFVGMGAVIAMFAGVA